MVRAEVLDFVLLDVELLNKNLVLFQHKTGLVLELMPKHKQHSDFALTEKFSAKDLEIVTSKVFQFTLPRKVFF